jgi:hypothetical protein
VRIHIDEVPKGVLISSGMTCTVALEAPPRQWAVLAAFDRWLAAGCRKGPEYDRHARYIARDGDGLQDPFAIVLGFFILGGPTSLCCFGNTRSGER